MTTEHGAGTIWVIFLAAGVGTFAIRLSFILLLGRLESVPPTLVGVLRFVPAAVLAGLVAPAIVVLSFDGGVGLAYETEKLLAGTVAAGVAWRTESVIATIGIGMVTLWALQWLV